MKMFIIIGALLAAAVADVSHLLIKEEQEITTPPPPPKPYAFGYAAGRFPGHIDRTHSEVSDGSGVVQGSYSYVDPRHQIRTVEYIADKNGFHPILNQPPPELPRESAAVALAKEKHFRQYNAIAQSHQNPQNQLVVPRESAAVAYATNKHLSLFEKIAAEHARIAAEREALRLAEEATKNSLEEQY